MSYTTLWEIPDDLWAKIEWILPPKNRWAAEGVRLCRTAKC